MRTIRITGIDKHLYEVIKDYISKRHLLSKTKTSARVLLELSGTWEDERNAEEIVREIKKARRSSESLEERLQCWIFIAGL